MNWFKIISNIEKADPEIIDRLDTRRKAMSDFGNMGAKLTAAALPFAISSMFNKAYGKTNDAVTDVLMFALKLEYLEYEFYKQGIEKAVVIDIPSGAPLAALTKIRNDEGAHVAFLKTVLKLTDDTQKPNIDLTGGAGSGAGPFQTALSDYKVFLAAAQTFEDTGVRAYKGQAANLSSNNDVLTAALNIHSVEARHASHIRQMRAGAAGGGANIDPWITLKDSGITGPTPDVINAVQKAYDGEEVTSQATVNITSFSGITADAASEAFDEILTMEEVYAITGKPGDGTIGANGSRFFY